MPELVHAFYAIFPFFLALYAANISINIARSNGSCFFQQTLNSKLINRMQFLMQAFLFIIPENNFNKNNHCSNDNKHKEVQIYFESEIFFRSY